MPHVIVKLWPGKSEQQKKRLADAIVKEVTSVLSTSEDSVSVAFQEIEPGAWRDEVYQPDIMRHADRLYKKPGYTM
jgi:4-oxalocrotonate tautomerase